MTEDYIDLAMDIMGEFDAMRTTLNHVDVLIERQRIFEREG